MEWILAIGGFALGLVGGIFLGQSSSGSDKVRKQIEEELQAVQDELNNYRNEVTMHFSRTADLFNAVTADYHKLYQHLAEGAQKFSQSDALLPEAVTKLVPLTEPASTETQEGEEGAEAVQEGTEKKGEGETVEEAVVAEGKVEEESGEAAATEETAEEKKAEETGAESGEEQGQPAKEEAAAEQPAEEESKAAEGEAAAEQEASGEKGNGASASAEESAAEEAAGEQKEEESKTAGSEGDTFTVPTSETETEKRLH
ncbi:MAG TPA: DUF1043 family protein [Gammaproteobacteria bacterium]|nr:DUF1043 family protein [Gammaproteobacteria bacterium]